MTAVATAIETKLIDEFPAGIWSTDPPEEPERGMPVQQAQSRDRDITVTPDIPLSDRPSWLPQAVTPDIPLSDRPSWLPQALRSISKLRQLDADWDSYGAEAPNEDAIQLARDLTCGLPEDSKPSQIGASAEGGVCVSFFNDDRYGDVECFNTGEVLAAITKRGEDTEVWAVNPTSEAMREAVDRVRAFIG